MPSTSPRPRTLKKLTGKYRKLQRTQDRIRSLYKVQDAIEEQLLNIVRMGDRIPLPNGKYAYLVDNFSGKNKAFRAHGISRFEFRVEAGDV